MVTLAEGGQDPAVGGWSEVNGAWLMLRMGPVTRTEVAAHLGLTPRTFTGRHRGIERVRAALFPSHKDAIPYMLLLTSWTGIVPDGLSGLEVSGIRWTGRQATLLSYTKGRTADESLVLSPRASRLLEQWLQHSALLRGHAPAELAEHVWLVTRQGRLARAAFEEYMMRGWVKAHDLRGDDGHLLRIDRRRLRTTFIAQHRPRQRREPGRLPPRGRAVPTPDPATPQRRPAVAVLPHLPAGRRRVRPGARRPRRPHPPPANPPAPRGSRPPHPDRHQGPAAGFRRSGILHGIHLVRASIGARDTEATAQWITALAGHVPHVQSVRCRTLLAGVRGRAGKQLHAAGRTDALDVLSTALSRA